MVRVNAMTTSTKSSMDNLLNRPQMNSGTVSLKYNQRQEKHRHKTMLKVMDPNVHQIMPVRRHNRPGISDDSDGAEYDTSRQNRRPVIIKHGISPKIAMAKMEMKKHISRQSELINSLEKSGVRNSREVFSLK